MTDEEWFTHTLALELGFPCPRTLLELLPFSTYESWKRFFNESPFGYGRSDIQAAIIAKCTLAPWVSSDLPLSEFMPYSRDDDGVSVEALERHIEEQRAREQAERRARRGDQS